jgi:hypothetical protein
MDGRNELENRWQQIAAELEAIASGEQPDWLFPFDRETALLAEQDRIERAIGELDRREE